MLKIVQWGHKGRTDEEYQFRWAIVRGVGVVTGASWGILWTWSCTIAERLVESAKGIMAQLVRAQREARAAFGDDAVLLDPVLDGPKAQ